MANREKCMTNKYQLPVVDADISLHTQLLAIALIIIFILITFAIIGWLLSFCWMPRSDIFRHNWVQKYLANLTGSILDVGCGPQIYRQYCSHLTYKAQDFGSYTGNGAEGLHDENWRYGPLDFTGNAWHIETPDQSFDNVMCTEVLEHVSHPRETIIEIGRILKKGGTALITAPINCIPHQNPYFFSHGLSKEFYQEAAKAAGLQLVSFETYSGAVDYMVVESYRGFRSGNWSMGLILIPLIILKSFGIKGPPYPCFGALAILKNN